MDIEPEKSHSKYKQSWLLVVNNLMPPHVCLFSDDLHLLLIAVVNEAPWLVHLLGGGVAAVVVPAHQLHVLRARHGDHRLQIYFQ